MKLTKKLLAALLAALMLVTAVPFAFAAPVTYIVEDGVLTVTGEGPMDDYNVQDAAWKQDANQITSIVIGDGITYIGAYAFKGLNKVTAVTIPDSVKEFGIFAFSGCTALQSIQLPAESTAVPRGVFSDCAALTAITIPAKVETICSYAFSNTGLTEIFLPLSVKTLEAHAFSGCTALKKITIKNTKCNIVSGALPPATPAGSGEDPVTIYAVYTSNGDNYAVANGYAVQHIPDEDKPAYDSPETIQEVVQISKTELKDTKIGSFFTRLYNLFFAKSDKKDEKTTVIIPYTITGPGAELGRLIMKTSLASFILRLRELLAPKLSKIQDLV